MIIHLMEQNTPEWDEIRLKKMTASVCPELLMSPTTKGYTDLIDKIIEERFTGKKSESKKWNGNSFTDRGHEYEPEARVSFEVDSLRPVKQVGFIESDDHWYGCSPDGLIEDNGMIQIKCPIFNTQRKYLSLLEKHKDLNPNEILKKIDGNYYKQMQFELMTAKREYNVFYSYHPNLKKVELKIIRDEEVIKQINTAKAKAIKTIEQELEKLGS